MEIGEQQVGRPDLPAAGAQEYVRLPFPGRNLARGAGRRFQQAERRGAGRDQSAPAAPDARSRLFRDAPPLAVHPVLGRVLRADRQEGAGADMQGDGGALDAARIQRRQQAGREMQPGRGRGDRARLAGEHRLVRVPVARVAAFRALDIGRQRHGAVRLKRRVEFRPFRRERQRDFPALPALLQHRFEPAGKGDPVALAEPPPGPGEGEPAPLVEALVQQGFDCRRAAPPVEARRDHARVVDNHEVARPEQVRQFGNAAVRESGRNMQQPRRVARLHRPLRDQPGGQVEIEIAGAQGHGRPAPPRAGTFAGPAEPVKTVRDLR